MHTYTCTECLVHTFKIFLFTFATVHRYCHIVHTIACTCTHTHTNTFSPGSSQLFMIMHKTRWLTSIYYTLKACRSIGMRLNLCYAFFSAIAVPFSHYHTFLPSRLAHDWLTGMAGIFRWEFLSVHVIWFYVVYI